MSSSLLPPAPLSSAADVQPPLLLSANVYCEGLVDELLQRAVAPFWRQVRQQEPRRQHALWMMRYSRRGAHLKVRVHGPPSSVERLSQQLGEHVEPFLASLGPVDPRRQRLSNLDISPLDPEDEGEALYPDRVLLWTSHRLVPGHLGREPLSAAPGFASGYVCCLSEVAELVLEHLVLEPGGGVRPATRFSLLMRLMMAALEGLGLRPEEELEYLLFHRDWLLLGSKREWQSAVSFLEQKVRSAGPQLERLQAAATRRHTGPREPQAPGPFPGWQQALRHHLHHGLAALGVGRYRELGREPRHQLLAALARVLHNTANLLGVDLSNEIHACHLLGASLRPLLGSEPPSCSFLVDATTPRLP